MRRDRKRVLMHPFFVESRGRRRDRILYADAFLSEANAHPFALDDQVVVFVDQFQFSGHFFQWNGSDVFALQGHHPAELAGGNHFGGISAHAGSQVPVERGG